MRYRGDCAHCGFADQQQPEQQQHQLPLFPPASVAVSELSSASSLLQIKNKTRVVTCLLTTQIRHQRTQLCEGRQQVEKEQSNSQSMRSELEQQRIVANQMEQTLQHALQDTQQTACVLLISYAVKRFLFRCQTYQNSASIDASVAMELYNVVDVQQVMSTQQPSHSHSHSHNHNHNHNSHRRLTRS